PAFKKPIGGGPKSPHPRHAGRCCSMEGILAYDFMQRAFLAGIMAGILCSFVSLFVVMQRLAFAGVGVSHSALGGVAIGVLTGVNPVLSAGLFCTAVAWLIGFISRKGDIHEDTVIG